MVLSLSYNPTPSMPLGVAARRRGAGCRRTGLKRSGVASTMVGMSHTGTSRRVRPRCGRCPQAAPGRPPGGDPAGLPPHLGVRPGLPRWPQPWGAGGGLAPAGRAERRCLARGHLRMQDKLQAMCSLGPQHANPEDPAPISKRTVREIHPVSEPLCATTRQTCPVEPHPGCAATVAPTSDLTNRAALVGAVPRVEQARRRAPREPRSQAGNRAATSAISQARLLRSWPPLRPSHQEMLNVYDRSG